MRIVKARMAIGPVHFPSSAGSGDGVPLDGGSTVEFSLGCDSGGVYMILPDEEETE